MNNEFRTEEILGKEYLIEATIAAEKGHGDLFSSTISFLCSVFVIRRSRGVPAKLQEPFHVTRSYR